jgi:hypothetical protein
MCRSPFILFWAVYTEPSIGAFYLISVHLAIRFLRRGFLNKSTNQKEELPVVAMFVIRSG